MSLHVHQDADLSVFADLSASLVERVDSLSGKMSGSHTCTGTSAYEIEQCIGTCVLPFSLSLSLSLSLVVR